MRFSRFVIAISIVSSISNARAQAPAASPVPLSAAAADPAAERPIQLPDFPDAPKGPPVAYLLRTKAPQTRIAELEFSAGALPVSLVSKDSDLKATVAIHGHFARPDWRLVTSEDGETLPTEFVLYVHLNGRLNQLDLTALGPGKQKEQERIYLYAPDARSFHVVSAWDDLVLATGFSFFSYKQSGFGNFQALEIPVGARYATPDAQNLFGFSGAADLSLLTLQASPINVSPQLLSVNADLTIRTRKGPLMRDRLRWLLGVSYLTMFSNGSPFGFADLTAPEIGLAGRRVISVSDDWLGEVRYVPIGGLTGLNQLGFIASFSRSHFLPGFSRRLEAGLAYSYFYYRPEATITIQITTLTLRLGATF